MSNLAAVEAATESAAFAASHDCFQSIQGWLDGADSSGHQINRINAEATDRNLTVVVVCYLVHVVEYLWKVAWSLHREADPAAEH